MENNSKTLKTIQTLCKVGRILSKITFIICIVGAALCVAGIISLALIPEGIKFDGLTIQGLVQKHAGVSVNTCYAAMAAGIALCAGGAVLAKFEELYFKRELASGTPFTFDGAKELIRLGVLTIAIPAVAAKKPFIPAGAVGSSTGLLRASFLTASPGSTAMRPRWFVARRSLSL